MIYFKMSFKNIKNLMAEYRIYFSTLILCSLMFFVVNSISSMPNFSSNDEYVMLMQTNLMLFKNIEYIVLLMSVPIIFLIIYINKYIIKIRAKEIANYIILGIPKYKINMLFFIENLFFNILGIVIGIIIGHIFSYFLCYSLVKYLGYLPEINIFQYKLNIKAIISTLKFFIIICLIANVYNVFIIKKVSILKLLDLDSQNEKIYFDNKKIFKNAILNIISLVTCITSSAIFIKIFLSENFDYKGFILVGIFFIILMTLLIFMFTFYSLINFIILKNQNKLKKHIDLFLLKEFSTKLNTKSKLFATISFSLMIVFVSSFAIMFSQKLSETTLKNTNLFDIRLDVENSHNKTDIEDINKFENYIKNTHKIESENLVFKYNLLDEEALENNIIKTRGYYPSIIKLGTFNEILKHFGYETITLNENEFTIYSSLNKIYLPILENGLKIENKTLKFKETNKIDKNLDIVLNNPNQTFSIIVSNNLVNNREYNLSLFLNVDRTFSIEDTSKLKDFTYTNLFKGENKDNYSTIQTYEGKRLGFFLNKIQIILIFLYLVIFLTIIIMTVISTEQLSNMDKTINKYEILKFIGVGKEELSKNIFKQVSVNYLMTFVFSSLLFIIVFSISTSIFSSFFTYLEFTNKEIFLELILLPVGLVFCIAFIYYLIVSSQYISRLKR